jgi:L-proline amide hydrolase
VDVGVVEGRLEHADGSHTWYSRTVPASPRPGALPLVALHGGPGMAHDYLRRVRELAAHGREVLVYDQVGCGRSSHHPHAPADHWTVDLFVRELHDLVGHWGIGAGFHLLGQSWGGMLAPEYVLAHPEGVASLTLMNSPAAMPDWAEGTRRLLGGMPADVRDAIERHEAAQTYDDPEYLAAVDAFYRRHLCRLDPWPQHVLDSFEQLEQDPSVYASMIGPSEFTITGTLAQWSVADRVHEIGVPTLVGYGEHDEATTSWRPFAERIAGAVVHEFAGASHTPHVETPDEFDRVVGDFLGRHDLSA